MSTKIRFCEICKQPIHPDRAENVPETRLCATHAEEIAKYGGEFKATGTIEGTGQKTGTGLVAIGRTRNTEALERLRRDYEDSQVDDG